MLCLASIHCRVCPPNSIYPFKLASQTCVTCITNRRPNFLHKVLCLTIFCLCRVYPPSSMTPFRSAWSPPTILRTRTSYTKKPYLRSRPHLWRARTCVKSLSSQVDCAVLVCACVYVCMRPCLCLLCLHMFVVSASCSQTGYTRYVGGQLRLSLLLLFY